MFSIIKSKLKNMTFLEYVFFFSVFAWGLFFEFADCIVSIILFIYLLYLYNKNKKLIFVSNIETISICVIVLFYAVSSLWAVDRGMAIWGFLKFLPVLLFLMCIIQLGNEIKTKLFRLVPYIGAIMTIISFVFMFIPVINKYFSTAGRISGFFQYPNVFALFLLLGTIILLTQKKLSIKNIILFVVLTVGIFATGSRTVFLIYAITLVIIAVFKKSKKLRITVFLILAVSLITTVLYVLLTDNFSSIGRYLTTSFSESTFIGRILYYIDAVPVILKNPFGLGYSGYYFIQNEIQTGVYSLKFIHNDFLQLLLDIGWIPVALFLAALAHSFFSKGSSLTNRLIMSVICIHCLFDYDLQFVSIFWILLLTMKTDGGKEFSVSQKAKPAVTLAVIILLPLCLYFGIATFADVYCDPLTALKIYPLNTTAQIKLLPLQSDVNKLDDVADDIIRRNNHVSLAYSAKALKAYSEGNIESFIQYKLLAIKKSPYSIEEYNDYCQKLVTAISLYEQNNDNDSADYCRQKLKQVPSKLEELRKKTSALAYMIDDKPCFELSKEYTVYINQNKIML